MRKFLSMAFIGFIAFGCAKNELLDKSVAADFGYDNTTVKGVIEATHDAGLIAAVSQKVDDPQFAYKSGAFVGEVGSISDSENEPTLYNSIRCLDCSSVCFLLVVSSTKSDDDRLGAIVIATPEEPFV